MASPRSSPTLDEAHVITSMKLANANEGYGRHYPTEIPGLYITARPERIQGQDSTSPPADHASQVITIPHYEAVTRVPGVTIRNHEVQSDLTAWYKPPRGPGTLVNICQPTGEEHNASEDDRNHIQLVHFAGLGGEATGSREDIPNAGEEAAKEDGVVAEGRAGNAYRRAAKHRGRANGKAAADRTDDENDEAENIFLFVREAYGGNGKLIIDTTHSTVRLLTMKDQETKTSTAIKFSTDSRIQIYPFLKGKTFRFINCGLRAKVQTGKNNVRKRMCDKKISTVLPPGSRDTEYPEYTGSDAKMYPVYDQEAATHNDNAIPEFIRQLGRIVGVERVTECDESQKPDVEILTG